MFSGKTEELIRRLKRARIAGQHIAIFKPAIDKRYDAHHIVSHDENRFRSISVETAHDILSFTSSTEVIAIDEAQFFDEGLTDVAEQLAANGARVIIAGLDMDFRGKPFGAMPALLAKADFITKLHAVCARCGDRGHFSYRLSDTDTVFLLGEKEAYEPRCRTCFYNA